MFAIDDFVIWTSSYTCKEGVVVEVVPAGEYPKSIDRQKRGGPRDHETYVIRGGERGKRKTLYWPRVNVLVKQGQLSPDELAWCHDNAGLIRNLMHS